MLLISSHLSYRKTTAGVAAPEPDGRVGEAADKKKRGSGGNKRQPKPSQRVRLGGVEDQFRVSTNQTMATGRIFEGSIFCVFECDFVYGKKLKVLDFPFLSSAQGSSSRDAFPLSPTADYETLADSGGRKYSRKELIEMIRSQGGEVEASPMSPDCQIVASFTGKRSLQLVNLIQDQSMVLFSLKPISPVSYNFRFRMC